ncbi:uncharacterized protein C8A04DRAFT_14544 [Dichotomopilus funicola]|uniref:Uncharacterized protein n=1 Tax=Dichotomopilus funicola TaxID=1934379 RepID=A0AAN6UXK7_9PEZI|nr:hypothetical protein C8A04DRAFT_14544 [Dichotomopilus funicola]
MPVTPHADLLREEINTRHTQEMDLYFAYKEAYQAWREFTRASTAAAGATDASDNEDIAKKQHELTTAALAAQQAYHHYNTDFVAFQAANPASASIMANMHADRKWLIEDRKKEAERKELIADLKGKDASVRRSDLKRFDEWAGLMKESRDREMWRSRVEVMGRAEEMILGQMAAAKAAEEAKTQAEAQAIAQAKAAEEAKAVENVKAIVDAQVAKQAAEEKKAGEAAAEAAQKAAEQSNNNQSFGATSYDGANDMNDSFKFDNSFPAMPESQDAALDFNQAFAQQNAEMEAGGFPQMELQDWQSGKDNMFSFSGQQDGAVEMPAEQAVEEHVEQQAQQQVHEQPSEQQFELPDYVDDEPVVFDEQPPRTTSHGLSRAEIDAQVEAQAQELFSADVQAQMPSISEVIANEASAPVPQPAGSPANNQAATPRGVTPSTTVDEATGRKIKTPRSRKTASPKGSKSKGIPMTMPGQAQHEALYQGQQQHTVDSSVGLQQVTAADPFLSSGTTQQLPNNGQGVFSLSVPPSLQQMTEEFYSSNGNGTGAQQPTPAQSQMAATPKSHATAEESYGELSIFMAKTPAQSAVPSSGTPAHNSTPNNVAQNSAHHVANNNIASGAAPSSSNKRKKPATPTQGMDTPTKRRQGTDQHGAVVSIPQDAQAEASASSSASASATFSHQTTASVVTTTPAAVTTPENAHHNNGTGSGRIPIDPALCSNVSPPSPNMPFVTAIKAGVRAAIAQLITESNQDATILGQVLLDGPLPDFNVDRNLHQAMTNATKQCIQGVHDTVRPTAHQQAYLGGAFRMLRAVFAEMDKSGSVWGCPLLDGPLAAEESVAVRKAMGNVYRRIMDEYREPTSFEEDGQAHARNISQNSMASSHHYHHQQQLQQQVHARDMSHHSHHSQHSMASHPSNSGSPHLQAQQNSQFANNGYGNATPVHSRNSSGNSHKSNKSSASSSHMLPFPELPADIAGMYQIPGQAQDSQAQLTTRLSSRLCTMLNSSTITWPTALMALQQQQAQQAQQAQQTQQPQPKKARKPAAPRKSRARKASTAPSTNSGARTPPGPGEAGTPDNMASSTPILTSNGQCIPRIYYAFADGTFYMHLTNQGGTSDTHHRMGRGTEAAETALGQFIQAAKAVGIEESPAQFVWRMWRGVEGNVEDLRGMVERLEREEMEQGI